MNDISEILNQLGDNNPYNDNNDNDDKPLEEPLEESLDKPTTLSDIISTIHQSFVYSQHDIQNTELESYKNDYNISFNMNNEMLSSKMLTIDGESIPQKSLTTQKSLSINDVNISLKINLCDIIEKNNRKEITVSKYNEKGDGFPTDFKFKFKIDDNLKDIE